MAVVIVTGSAGLIGSETVRFFCDKGFDVVGIDNDMRRRFFGDEASTDWNRSQLEQRFPKRYTHASIDIRDTSAVDQLLAMLFLMAATIAVRMAPPTPPPTSWPTIEPRSTLPP